MKRTFVVADLRTSRFINDRFNQLFKQGRQDHARLRMIFYASLLMAFFKNHRMASKRAALKSVLGIPNPLLEGLLSRYTEEQLTSTRDEANPRDEASAASTTTRLSGPIVRPRPTPTNPSGRAIK